MTKDSFDKHARRSVRLQGYDYAQSGAYFVTICTHNRKCLFGEIVDDRVQLNEFGVIVQEEWLRTAVLRPNIELDSFVVMPNHFHGIIMLMGIDVGANRRFAPTWHARTDDTTNNRPAGTTPGSISAILQQFKSIVTKRINVLRDTPGAPVWQRSFHDHIIRNERSLNDTRQYIENNPTCWAYDKENPANF